MDRKIQEKADRTSTRRHRAPSTPRPAAGRYWDSSQPQGAQQAVQAGWRQASVFSVGRLGLALCTEQGGRPHAAARERRCADPDCRARARGLHAFGEVLQSG